MASGDNYLKFVQTYWSNVVIKLGFCHMCSISVELELKPSDTFHGPARLSCPCCGLQFGPEENYSDYDDPRYCEECDEIITQPLINEEEGLGGRYLCPECLGDLI